MGDILEGGSSSALVWGVVGLTGFLLLSFAGLLVWEFWQDPIRRTSARIALFLKRLQRPIARTLSLILIAYLALRLSEVIGPLNGFSPVWLDRSPSVEPVIAFLATNHGYVDIALLVLLFWPLIWFAFPRKPTKPPPPPISISPELIKKLSLPINVKARLGYRVDRSEYGGPKPNNFIVIVPCIALGATQCSVFPVSSGQCIALGLEEGLRYDITQLNDCFKLLYEKHRPAFKHVMILRKLAHEPHNPPRGRLKAAGEPPDTPLAVMKVEKFRTVFQSADYLDLRALNEAIGNGSEEIMEEFGFTTFSLAHTDTVYDGVCKMVQKSKSEAMVIEKGTFVGTVTLKDLYEQLTITT